MSEHATTVHIDKLADMVRSEPDDERDCLLCHKTMAAPDRGNGEEARPLCGCCSDVALGRLAAEVERLRAMVMPSPAGTVRLLYTDGTCRYVDPAEPLPFKDDAGDLVERAPLNAFDWRSWGRRGYRFRVAVDWDATDGSACYDWATVHVETFEQEAARERAARIEAERQRDEARAEAERGVAAWIVRQTHAQDQADVDWRTALRIAAHRLTRGEWRREEEKR